ncbi:unnamed protein product [Arabis nemorensis]|uniref:SWIM-type domain-containing protein n=1 Tax=Arabis nemorensis TaxID=586526 RepID=A0A565B0S1_9BRAS|nr:unnamed protein product [Arabis nemorensis]
MTPEEQKFVIGIPLVLIFCGIWFVTDLYRELLLIKDHRSSSQARNYICSCNHSPDYLEDLEKALSKTKCKHIITIYTNVKD